MTVDWNVRKSSRGSPDVSEVEDLDLPLGYPRFVWICLVHPSVESRTTVRRSNRSVISITDNV